MTDLAPAQPFGDTHDAPGGGFLLAAANELSTPTERTPPHPLTRTAIGAPTSNLATPCGLFRSAYPCTILAAGHYGCDPQLIAARRNPLPRRPFGGTP